jgi:hypothetical protein
LAVYSLDQHIEKLSHAFKDLEFSGREGFIFGGRRKHEQLLPSIIVFPEHNFGVSYETGENTYAQLQQLGYIVPDHAALNEIPKDNRLYNHHRADYFLWRHIVSSKRIARCPSEEILNKIARTFPDVQEFRFQVYSPRIIDEYSYRDDDYVKESEPSYVLSRERICDIIDKVPKDPLFTIALRSDVVTAEGVYHIPMMDFKDTDSAVDPQHPFFHLVDLGERHSLHKKGKRTLMIVNSGNAYHSYGKELLNREELQEYLKTQHFFKRTDKHWIKKSEIDGFCSLRLFACWAKPYYPEIKRDGAALHLCIS